jgi:hypothetical protein
VSEKTVAAKMGMKPGQRVLAINAPRAYPALLGGLPAGAKLVKDTTGSAVVADLVHLFVKDRAELGREAARALAGVGEGNLLWISYPKKTSGVATDISRDVGWEPIRAAGWEPVSIVSIDDTWAALRWKRAGTIPARAKRQAQAIVAKPADEEEGTQRHKDAKTQKSKGEG